MRDEVLTARFEFPLMWWCAYSAVCLLRGWCLVKLLPSRRVLCTPCLVISCKVTYVGCMHVGTNLLPALTTGTMTGIFSPFFFFFFLRATAVTPGWNGYRKKSQHRKLTLEKKILPPLLPGLDDTRPFHH